MAENIFKAKQMLNTVAEAFDSMGWTYEKHEDELLIKSGAKGDDLPIEFIVVVRSKQEVVQLLSRLPFSMPEGKRVDGAIAVCVANQKLVDGSFDYSITDGDITFRLTSSYRDSIISPDLVEYMIGVSVMTIDDYNDKFFMISKGVLTVEQFIEQENS